MDLSQRVSGLRLLLFALASCLSVASYAQQPGQAKKIEIRAVMVPAAHKVTIMAGSKLFTEFLYPDTLEKPILWPILAPDGQLVTRGFPFQPLPGEPVDHPHHQGLWFTYENVNGLDFWNNSFAIPEDKKHLYGWIRTDPASIIISNEKGTLQYSADWTDQQRNTLLKETTTFVFTATGGERIIDRATTLTAAQDVSMPDAKDGLLGMRVTKELQIPSNTPGQFIDNKGNITKVAAGNDPVINGNYLTSEGKQGDSAWSTRGSWCMLYGKKMDDTLSIVVIDHPANPGYPTYWHARGYGLFAANPLGQKIFSKDKETMNFSLKKGDTVTFRYRIVIASGKERLSTGRIGQLADTFARSR